MGGCVPRDGMAGMLGMVSPRNRRFNWVISPPPTVPLPVMLPSIWGSISGNVGAIALADRGNGRVSMITLWDSSDSMQASTQAADQLRQQTAEMSDQKITNVALYDVPIAQTVEGARA